MTHIESPYYLKGNFQVNMGKTITTKEPSEDWDRHAIRTCLQAWLWLRHEWFGNTA